MIHRSRAAAHVACVNKVHHEVNRLLVQFKAVLLPYVGKQVQRADGKLLLKLVREMHAVMEKDPNMMAWPISERYSIGFYVKGWETFNTGVGGDIAEYVERYAYLGELKGVTLVSMPPEAYEPFKCCWTVEEARALMAEVRFRKVQLQQAENAFRWFKYESLANG